MDDHVDDQRGQMADISRETAREIETTPERGAGNSVACMCSIRLYGYLQSAGSRKKGLIVELSISHARGLGWSGGPTRQGGKDSSGTATAYGLFTGTHSTQHSTPRHSADGIYCAILSDQCCCPCVTGYGKMPCPHVT